MKRRDWSPRQDLGAKATQAAREVQNLPPWAERIEAMKKRRRTDSATRRIPITVFFPANSNRQMTEILGVRATARVTRILCRGWSWLHFRFELK